MNVARTIRVFQVALFALAWSFFLAQNSWAGPTTARQAELAVRGWLQVDPKPLDTVLGSQVGKVETFAGEDGNAAYHIVYLRPSGFAIVPADDLIEPIIGFADDGVYDPSLDNPLGALVTSDLNARLAFARNTQHFKGEVTRGALGDAQAKWRRLLDLAGHTPEAASRAGLSSISDVCVAPFVESEWSQCEVDGGCPGGGGLCYNYYTPNQYACGCVATAMAQVMRFHQHPTAGIGQNTFTIRVDGSAQQAGTRGGDGFGGAYDWNSMVLIPANGASSTERQAIGALTYDSGVAALMSYGPLPPLGLGSAAFLANARTALDDTFMYGNAIYGFNNWSNIGPPLNGMMNPNLDYGQPVILGIRPGLTDGHAVVVDGYGYEAVIPPPAVPTLYHHFNMGWAGVQDAWYNITADMPPNYNNVAVCIYNIFVSGTGEIISGRVTDAYGDPVGGVSMKAERAGGGTLSTVTDSSGIYAFGHVFSNSWYTVSATMSGYSFSSRTTTTGTSTNGFPTPGNRWGIDFTPFGVGVIFVDDSAIGSNNGTNWPNAYNYLQDALAAASSGNIILVAAGTYKPDQGGGTTPGAQSATFQLKNGVEIYGGFPSGGANSWDDRDPHVHESILSGDINTAGDNTDNSYHVTMGSGTNATAVLDGFIITAGSAHGSYPNDDGGGMYSYTGSPTISNCTFIRNSADYGAGMFNNMNSSPAITNCDFIDNAARVVAGGIFNVNASSPTLVNCTFSGNGASLAGGMHNWVDSIPTLINCTFSGNTGYRGAGMSNRTRADATLINCVFSRNAAEFLGGAIYNENSDPTLDNCILWGNTDDDGQNTVGSAQIYDDANSTSVVNYSCIQGVWGGSGANNKSTNPKFVDSDGADNTVGTEDDDLKLSSGSPCIDAGDDMAVPADTADIDDDGDTSERTPLDVEGRFRFWDDPVTDDTGVANPPNYPEVVDMGACEYGAPKPGVATPPHEFRKNRHLGFEPEDVGPVAIRVEVAELVCDGSGDPCSYDEDCPPGEICVTQTGDDPNTSEADDDWEAIGWVGEPCRVAQSTQVPADTFTSLVVSDIPPFYEFTEPVVYVTDCEIQPRRTYALSRTVDGSSFSDRLIIGTILEPTKNGKHWADVVGQRDAESGEYTEPNRRINVDDVQVMIVFLNSKSYRPHLTVLDLSHEVPGYKINADDLQMVMRAFNITEDYPPLKFQVEASGAVHPRDCPFDAADAIHSKCE